MRQGGGASLATPLSNKPLKAPRIELQITLLHHPVVLLFFPLPLHVFGNILNSTTTYPT